MKSFTAVGLAALSTLASVQAISIDYDAYNADRSCKSQAQFTSDFKGIYNSGSYSQIRLYGTDCDQVSKGLNALKATGRKSKLFAGIYDVNQANSEAQTLINQARNDWDLIDTVSVGNEGVAGNKYSVQTVANAVNSVRSQLQNAGYRGHVVTVDIFYVYLQQPALCNVGDYVAVNMQAYYDGNVAAADSGSFIQTQKNNVANKCGGKRVVITEAGWPSAGPTKGKAVPSKANQQAAISSLRRTGISDLFLFLAYNAQWQSSDVERSFGFLGNGAPKSKREARPSSLEIEAEESEDFEEAEEFEESDE